MINKLLSLVFIYAILFPLTTKAQTEFYGSLKYRTTNWFDLEESIYFDDDTFKSIDMNIRTGSSWKFGLLLDIGNFQDDISKWALRIGRNNWGLLIEKGDIRGHFIPNSDTFLDIQPSGNFTNEYSLYSLYTGKYANYGITYLTYTKPEQIVVSYQESHTDEYGFTYEYENSYNYIDPEAEYQLWGGYFAFDGLKHYTTDGFALFEGDWGAFLLATEVAAGFAVGSVSEVYREEVENDINATISYESRNMLAMYGGLKVGYMNRLAFQKSKLGFAAGFEYRLHGEFFTINDKYGVQNTAQIEFWNDILYGFFFRVAYVW